MTSNETWDNADFCTTTCRSSEPFRTRRDTDLDAWRMIGRNVRTKLGNDARRGRRRGTTRQRAQNRQLHSRVGFPLPMPRLPIHQMATRHLGLTPAIANAQTEAASVCLDRHHASPVEMTLDRDGKKTTTTVDWPVPDTRTRSAWANETDATEAGACACVLAAVEVTDGLLAVGRAEMLTGADYYVAPEGKGIDDLDECRRLEVSGTDRGVESVIRRRLTEKLAQAERGNANLPATAGVVGFQARQIMLADLD